MPLGGRVEEMTHARQLAVLLATSGKHRAMIDAWGQRVRSFKLMTGRNTIDVSALPPGVYLLRTSDGRIARVMNE